MTTATTYANLRTSLFTPGHALTRNPVAASRLRRMGAFSVDVLVYGALASTLTFFFNLVGTTVASLLYASFHDCTLGPGRSLGRSAVGHRLLHTDGREVSHGTAIARNALRWLMWSTGLLLMVDLVLFFVGDGRLIADYILNTQVSDDPEEARRGRTLNVEATSDRDTSDTYRTAASEIDFDRPEFAERELENFDRKLADAQKVRAPEPHVVSQR